MHKLFQDNLRRLVEPNDAAKVHAWSKDYWLQRAGETDWKLRGLAWVHWRHVNHSEAINSYDDWLIWVTDRGNIRARTQMTTWWQDTNKDDCNDSLSKARDLYAQARSLPLTGLKKKESRIKAFALNENALQLIKGKNDFSLEGKLHENIAQCYFGGTGSYHLEESIHTEKHYRLAITAFTQANMLDRVGKCWRALGYTLRNRQEGQRAEILCEAEECYRKAHNLANPDSKAKAQSLQGLGYVFWNRLMIGQPIDPQTILDFFYSALTIFDSKNYPVDAARLRFNLGDFFDYTCSRDLLPKTYISKGLDLCNETANLFTREEFPLNYHIILRIKSQLVLQRLDFTEKENYLDSKKILDEAMQIIVEEGVEGYPTIRKLLGLWHYRVPFGNRSDNLTEAYNYFRYTLDIYNQEGEFRSKANTCYYLGLIQCDRGLFVDAHLHLQESLNLYTEQDIPYWIGKVKDAMSRLPPIVS